MSNNERNELVHALVAASNAFHRVLKERGYEVSYGLDGTKTGSIKKVGIPAYENGFLGTLTILWNLDKQIKEYAMNIEDHRRYFIKEEYWDRWGVVEAEDAYICHDVLDEYAEMWGTTVEELLKQMVEV